jgi:glycosyltransferase involved in cell wall biosynthesis
VHICYIGYYDPSYPRNALLRRGLIANGAQLTEIRIPSWLAPGHSSPSPTVPRALGERLPYEAHELRKAVRRNARVIRRTHQIVRSVDVVVVAEFSQGLVPAVAAVCRQYNKPVVVDLLISLFDEAVNHRQTLSARKPRAVARWLLDATAIRLADVVLADTAANAEFLEGEFGGLRDKVHVVEIGAPEWQFPRASLRTWVPGDPLAVLFYGYSQPLQGVGYIVEAANRLRDDDGFQFKIVGVPPDRGTSYGHPPTNLEFLPPVDASELRAMIAASDICLGVFGELPIAARVVPNKVWQCLAVGRPVITRDGPGPRSVLEDGHHCLLVPPGDPAAIVAALERLAADPALAARLAATGSELVHTKYSSGPLGRRLLSLLSEITATNPVPVHGDPDAAD